jgi:hypothetical protein
MSESVNDQLPSLKVSTWYGRPLTDLNREELLDCVEYLGEENEKLRRENFALHKIVNPLDLLLQTDRK